MKKRAFVARRLIWIFFVGSLLFPTISTAGANDADAIMKQMITVMENWSYSHKLDIILTENEKVVGTLLAGLARKKAADGNRSLVVFLEPESIKGIAYLFHRQKDATVDHWVYLPYLGRARKVKGLGVYENFLGTDFLYGDLLFYYHRSGSNRLIEKTDLNGTETYKIETVLGEKDFLFSKIVTFVSTENYVPVRRDYYDLAGVLWKQEFFKNTTVIDSHPVPLSISMKDLRASTGTELRISEISTDLSLLADDIFVPEQLKYSLVCPIWEKVCYPMKNKKEGFFPKGVEKNQD